MIKQSPFDTCSRKLPLWCIRYLVVSVLKIVAIIKTNNSKAIVGFSFSRPRVISNYISECLPRIGHKVWHPIQILVGSLLKTYLNVSTDSRDITLLGCEMFLTKAVEKEKSPVRANSEQIRVTWVKCKLVIALVQ